MVFLGLALLFLVGSQGHSGNSFIANPFVKVLELVALVSFLVWIALSPRDRKLVIDDRGIAIPSVLLPPYGSVFIAWHDIRDAYTVARRNGNTEMIIVTRASKFKVRSWLIQGDFEISFFSENFEKFVDEVFRRLPQLLDIKEEERWQ